MKTEQELKADCTPEIIKKMCELAEGFELIGDVKIYFNDVYSGSIKNIIANEIAFPLLIHRAVEGWNNEQEDNGIEYLEIIVREWGCCVRNHVDDESIHEYFKRFYQPTTLTHTECAMLDCLLEVLK